MGQGEQFRTDTMNQAPEMVAPPVVWSQPRRAGLDLTAQATVQKRTAPTPQ